MTELTLTANIDQPDDFYADLIDAHEGLSKEDSDALNARLILILANHVGNRAILKQALDTASLSKGG